MFLDLAYAHAPEIRALANDLHLHPELSMQEVRTTELLRSKLRAIGAELIDADITHGAVALLRGGSPGPLIALRADIDALLLHEEPSHRVCSLTSGVMHGCGHDVHTASLWGCALLLAENRQLLHGDVLLIFQPAEETLCGARYLLDRGIFAARRPDALFGLHNDPTIDFGSVGIRSGPLMSCKDGFRIRYIGKSGHTSTPQANIDPTVAIASLVLALQTIVSRNVGPLETAVLSVCSIAAGNPFATTVDDGEITGNIRTLEPAVRDVARRRLRDIAAHTAAAFSCKAEIEITEITPAVVNDPALCSVVQQAARNALGAQSVVEPPVNLASEDFSILGAGIPSFFYFLGSGIPGEQNALWHSPQFCAHPDTPISGAALLAQTVLEAQRQLMQRT